MAMALAQMSRHGRLALEYWETYRPQALAELGSPQEQERFFLALDARVSDRISTLAGELLEQVPIQERGQARRAVRSQAQEIVYDEEVYLPKEPGTEHREL
jgi:hypothetical protein